MADVSESVSDAAGFWQNRYGERDQIWSGRPNQALVDTVATLSPGRALDLGCGEGGDSVWLAAQGWQVTAVDIAALAVTRAKTLAATHGIPDGSIAWLVEDLARWEPAGSYDLVSACFLHSPVDFPRSTILRRAAATVAAGGHLLIVSHAEPPPWSQAHGHGEHRFLGPQDEIAALSLDAGAWDTLVSQIRSREGTGPDGQRATLRDSVVLARHR